MKLWNRAMDVLELAIMQAIMYDRYRARPGHPGKPGELIERLSKEAREQLVNLKSDDVANIRKDAIF